MSNRIVSGENTTEYVISNIKFWHKAFKECLKYNSSKSNVIVYKMLVMENLKILRHLYQDKGVKK